MDYCNCDTFPNQLKTKLTEEMKLSANIKNRSNAGFSLIELLTVIAVIGILAAIALPALFNVPDSADRAKSQRNAQLIANIYTSGRAAGVTTATFGVNSPTADAAAAATAVVNALSQVNAPVHGEGPCSNFTFSVSQISPSDVSAAASYLVWNDTHKMLSYDASQGAGAPSGNAN